MKVPFFEPLYVILVYIHPYNSRTLNKQKIWLALGCPCSHLTINPRAHRFPSKIVILVNLFNPIFSGFVPLSQINYALIK